MISYALADGTFLHVSGVAAKAVASYVVLPFLIAFPFLLAGAWFDWKKRTVPNWLIAIFALVSLFSAFALPYLNLGDKLFWAASLLAMCYALHKKLHFGIGDVAFSAALGLLLGVYAGISVFVGLMLLYSKKFIKGIDSPEPFLVYLLVAFILVSVFILG